MERILNVCKKYLAGATKAQDMAFYVSAIYLTRPDVKDSYLPGFIKWAHEPREAKFAFRSTDLSSWASSSAAGATNNTDSDPTTIQHWAVVVHFPRGKKTYLFEAWEDNGKLQPGRAEIVFKEIEIFEKATYFGTAVTSPSDLLIKANQIRTGIRYDVFGNNCQTWVKDFLDCVSPELLVSLYEKVPATETYLSYLARQLEKLSKISS